MSEERIIIPITFEDYEKKAILWAKDYANDVAHEEKMIYESAARRYCVIDLYKTFVRNKKLEKIDLMELEEKKELLETSKRIFPQEMERDLRRQLCIFLYFMNHIFETYF